MNFFYDKIRQQQGTIHLTIKTAQRLKAHSPTVSAAWHLPWWRESRSVMRKAISVGCISTGTDSTTQQLKVGHTHIEIAKKTIHFLACERKKLQKKTHMDEQ